MQTEAIGQAWERLDRGESAAVVAELAALPADAPEPAILLRGLARYDSGDAAGAAEDFAAVLARDPQNPVAANHLALARFRTGDAAGAAQLFEDTPLFPQFGFLQRFLHLFWPLRGRTGIAAAVYGKEAKPGLSAEFARFEAHADRVSPRQRKKLASAMMRLGTEEFYNGHYVAARTLTERALIVLPESDDLKLTNCAFALLDGRAEDALRISEPLLAHVNEELAKDFSQAKHIHPDIVMVRAASMHALGNHETALRLISCVAPMGPDDWGSHFYAAMAWHALGNRERADATLRIALGAFFLDTWENIVRPFLLKTRVWLRTEEAATYAREHAPAENN